MDRPALLINRDGSILPMNRVYPDRRTIVMEKVVLRPWWPTQEGDLVPPPLSIRYRFVGEAGPYDVYGEIP